MNKPWKSLFQVGEWLLLLPHEIIAGFYDFDKTQSLSLKNVYQMVDTR
jgi:hypothetical protein